MALNVRSALLGVADALALGVLRPDVHAVCRDLTTPGPRLASLGTDRVLVQLCGAAAWLLAVWVAVGLLAIGGARLPGTFGRCARQVARLVVPRVVASLLAGSAGIGVLLAPVAADAVPSPVWPSVPRPHSSSSHVPAPAWPSSTPAHPKPARPKPARPQPVPQLVPAPVPVPVPHGTSDGQRVVPGDSLWLLAARRLGADATPTRVAAYWPQIYAANRSVIGDDPSLITPGERLSEPAPTATSITTTAQEPTS